MYGMGNSSRAEFVDNFDPKKLDDVQLTLRLKQLAADERASLVVLLSHIAEFDRRKLYGPLGYSSMFVYCTTVLKFSEDMAYRRIHAAPACVKFPEILAMLQSGELQLAAVSSLAPYLTEANRRELLAKAAGKTTREVAMLVAALAPQTEKADVIRRLPESEPVQPAELTFAVPCSSFEPAPAATSATHPSPPGEDDSCPPRAAGPCPLPPPRIEAVAPDRIRFSFTGDEALLRKVERAQAILWHKHPAGKLEDIFAEALDFLLDKKDPERRLEQKKRLKRRPPSSAADTESRRIPHEILHASRVGDNSLNTGAKLGKRESWNNQKPCNKHEK